MALLRRLYNPALFQGQKKKRKYFEGWYHKHVPVAASGAISIICGVAYDADGAAESFVQVLNGEKSAYIPYPIDDFRYETDRYCVYIGPNRFSAEGLHLHIDRKELQLEGELRYGPPTPLQHRTLLSPGIMGWYRFVPVMECYHGIVSLDHPVHGTLKLDGTNIDLTGGRGYIEKDWGSSMPEAWVWFQTNSFSEPGSSVLFSIARIPWLGHSFPGFFAVCHTPQQQQRFATYAKSRITSSRMTDRTVDVSCINRTHELTIHVQAGAGGDLVAPVSGKMNRTIFESVQAHATVTLKTLDGYVIFRDRASHAGLEVTGQADALLNEITN